MLYATLDQGYAFVVMLAAGVLAGAYYSFLSCVRRALSAGFWLTLFSDLLFGAGLSVILFMGMYACDYAEVHAYSFAAAILGFAIYMLGLNRLICAACSACARGFCRILKRVSKNRLIKVIFK